MWHVRLLGWALAFGIRRVWEELVASKYDTMRSVGDRVLVRPDDTRAEKVSPGGIIKPATADTTEAVRFGEVLSVGSAVKHVKAGNRIAWLTQHGDFADGAQGYELMSLHERDVAVVLE